jgi:hypothetical protein
MGNQLAGAGMTDAGGIEVTVVVDVVVTVSISVKTVADGVTVMVSRVVVVIWKTLVETDVMYLV